MSGLAKQKKKHIKAVQQKRRLFRANEPLLSVLMWGINHSSNALSHINIPVMLMPDDFKAHSKIRVDNHLFNKENMPSHFKFKEYCPVVFRNLRERFGTDEETYVNSLTKGCPRDSDSSGRSGARFLTSVDKRFIVKTISSEEVAEMHRIIKDYHQYVVERHAETLLPQYQGMYRVTVNDNETYFIVMRNIFSGRLNIHKKYDLKGSTVARHASDKEKAKELPTYKDNDFVNDGVKIEIGPDAKIKIMAMLTSDIEFLAKLNLMDYSMLVGIHDVDRAETEATTTQSDGDENGVDEEDEEDVGAVGFQSTPPDSPLGINNMSLDFDGQLDPETEQFAVKCSDTCPRREIYFMALIDILTHYGVKKRTAQAAKTVKHGAGAEISTVKPDQYAKRFLEFVERNLE